MNIKEVRELVNLLNKTDLSGLEWQSGEDRLILKKEKETVIASAPAVVQAAPAVASAPAVPTTDSNVSQPAAAAVADADLYEIKSPMVGTFYAAPSPESPAYAKVGDSISSGQVVCIVEAMKLMNEIESEQAGTIVEMCVENAQPVEFGTVLFRVKKS